MGNNLHIHQPHGRNKQTKKNKKTIKIIENWFWKLAIPMQ
jgi:hypothetical protein